MGVPVGDVDIHGERGSAVPNCSGARVRRWRSYQRARVGRRISQALRLEPLIGRRDRHLVEAHEHLIDGRERLDILELQARLERVADQRRG